MLGKEIIRKELTRVDIDAKTPIALFECMGKTFLEMGYVNDKYVPSIISRKLVFLLGFNDPNAHIELLQILIYNFQRPEWVEKLFSARTDEELYDAVYSMEWKHE